MSLIEKSIQLKNEGLKFSYIRDYLKNKGASEGEIKSIIIEVENKEVEKQLRKQQVAQSRNHMLISLMLLFISIAFNGFKTGNNQPLDWIFLIGIIGINFYTYFKFKNAKTKQYSIASMIKQNRSKKRSQL